MEAIKPAGAQRAAQAVTVPAAPAQNGAASGGGPTSLSANETVLGTQILNPPNGEVKEITLPDGSKLVPIARVLPNGQTAPLTAAPFAPAAAAPAAQVPAPPATSASLAAATAAIGASGNTRLTKDIEDGAPEVRAARTEDLPGFDPDGFLYRGNYYAKFHRAEDINLNDEMAVDRRLARATLAYLQEEHPELGDFGISDIAMRRATAADVDLLRVNPRSHWIANVHGIAGATGHEKTIPVVMNADGSVYVDPIARRT